MSSIFIRFLKMWYQNIQKNNHKQRKISKKIFEKILFYFWVNFGVKNEQKSPNSGFLGGLGESGPLKISSKIMFGIIFMKYMICRVFWYQVYPNRIKNKISVIFFFFFWMVFFSAGKADFYEKKIKNLKKHRSLVFYSIWINLVPKYCANLIYFEKIS